MFNKWELVEENAVKLQTSYGLLYGVEKHQVVVDVYRKKKLNGIYKYKTVVKYYID